MALLWAWGRDPGPAIPAPVWSQTTGWLWTGHTLSLPGGQLGRALAPRAPALHRRCPSPPPCHGRRDCVWTDSGRSVTSCHWPHSVGSDLLPALRPCAGVAVEAP